MINRREVDRQAKILWDYLRLDQKLEKADAILVLGSQDIRVAQYGGQLFLKKYAPLIIFSGGFGKITRQIWDKPEAEVFAQEAIKLGVLKEKILIENQSTNTGENILFTKRLLEKKNFKIKKLLVVHRPYMGRRTCATFKKVWPEVKIVITSFKTNYENYPNELLSKDYLINTMVGYIRRIIDYPKLGFQIYQRVPNKVLKAYEGLIKMGFSKDKKVQRFKSLIMKKMHVHFMGMGGSALAGVAILAKKMDYEVSGCDVQKETYYTKALKASGIDLLFGHNPKHLKKVDLVAVSPAVLAINADHPEVIAAKKKGILVTWQEFVGQYLQKNKLVVAVAGTHGKSTTTALAGLVLEKAGLDPTVVVGAMVSEWQTSVRSGQSKYFVIEADEYNLNFLQYAPSIIILNNIEMDHPEYFKDFEEVKSAFKRFIKKLVGPKILIANQSNLGVMGVIREMREKKELRDIEVKFYSSEKKVKKTGKNFTLKLFGQHNLANASGVLKLAEYLGIKKQSWGEVFASFGGLGRRMEEVGEVDGVKIFDDYAVHPTAVAATLTALRERYPTEKIWAVFEPHQYSRLRLFMDAFAHSLSQASKIIITRAYAGREKNTGEVQEEELVTKIGPKAIFESDFEKIVTMIDLNLKKGLVVVFGAGKSYQLSQMLVEKKLKIQRDVLLAPLTTFKIGGPARYFAVAENENELKNLLAWAKNKALPHFILGGGSNLLIADQGYDGLVIKIRNLKFVIDNLKIVCGAGVSLSDLVNKAKNIGLHGLEFAVGIPGTVGGAIRGNAGAWQQAIGDLVLRVRVMDTHGKFRWLRKSECGFAYRTSRFKTSGEIVWEVELNLQPGDKNDIDQKMQEYLRKRSGQPKEPSAGCVFVNPKPMAAGQLIDQAGLKGRSIGGAKISEEHANFIVNTSKATAVDVVNLIEIIKKSVRKKFNLVLQEEVQLVGF